MVAKTWGFASTAIDPVESLCGEAAWTEAGTIHSQTAKDRSTAPITLNRADAPQYLVLAGISDLVPLTSSVAESARG